MREVFQQIERNPAKDNKSVHRMVDKAILGATKFCKQFKIEEIFDQESQSDLFAVYFAGFYISDNKYDMQTSRNNLLTKIAIKFPIIGKMGLKRFERGDSVNSAANLVTDLLAKKAAEKEGEIYHEILSQEMSKEMSIRKWLDRIVNMMDTAHLMSIAVIKHETQEDDPQDLNNAIRELKISYMAKRLKHDKLS